MLIEYWKEETYSLYQIRNASGKGIDCEHGLTITEALNALDHYGLQHYDVAFGVDANFVKAKLDNGPVLVGVGYYRYPNKRGGPCSQSNTAHTGGRIDCGFGGAHAILAIGTVGTDVLTRDPDHWEKTSPKYDRMTSWQLTNAMNGLKGVGWSNTFVLYTNQTKKIVAPPEPTPTPVRGEDEMYNVGPSSTYRDAVLKAGTVLYSDSTLTQRYSAVSKPTRLGFHGSGGNYHVVINGGRTNYVRKVDVSDIIEFTRNYR